MTILNNLSKERKFDLIVFLIILIITGIVFIISTDITNNKIRAVENEKYNIYSKKIKDQIKTLINNKEELTLSIALALSEDTKLKNVLKEKNIADFELEKFSKIFAKKTNLKNIWFQIIDKEGKSIYRSWVKKRGDSLIKARLDISRMIENPKVMSTISTGKFDMTFKSMVPVYDKGNFIGIFEIITHFNSISQQLQKEQIDTVILVDKRYKKQLSKAINDKFINKYYIANNNAKEKWLDYINKYGVKTFISSRNNFLVDKVSNQLITKYYIPDIDGKPMGYIIAFKNLNSINMNDIDLIKTNIIFYAILFVVLLTLTGYYLVSNKYNKELDKKVDIRTNELHNEKAYIQTILDSNPSIILVTKNSKLISANKTFFDFFGYKDIYQFKKQNNCICDYFLYLDEEEFP